MRLVSIKVAGFKSFVDPITIFVPGQMSGVVGPNGAGKSNVIDAVRWVAGESSAKSLRSETLEDVIFNGSITRKPAGRASVELKFENLVGRAPGMWSRFAEISVRRVLTRDGVSEYYINNSRCRRKDVTELFLGSGFGARSYSIIEQGMIGQIVESKPEDFSVFIEEASGISRFRDKRRETQSKIKSTRDNLDRLDDMRGEVESRLRRLKYQAGQAKKFQTLKAQEKNFKLQLQAYEWRKQTTQISEMEGKQTSLELKKEERMAIVRATEAKLEQARKAQLDVQDHANRVTLEQYQINAEISDSEQKIEEVRTNRKQSKQQLEELIDEIANFKQQVSERQKQTANAQENVGQLKILKKSLQEDLHVRRGEFEEQDTQLRQQTGKLQELDDELLKAVQQRESVRIKREGVKHDLIAAEKAISACEQKIESNRKTNDSDELSLLEQTILDIGASCEELEKQSEQTEMQLFANRAERDQLLEDLEGIRESSRDMRVSLLELENRLQQNVYENSDVQEWLAENRLQAAHHLSETIKVKNGWERALDRVLGEKLSALCVEDLDSLAISANELSRLCLVENNLDENELPDRFETLAQHVQCKSQAIKHLLAGVYVSDSLSEALEQRTELKSSEFFVVAEGAMVGFNWFAAAIGEAGPVGVLEAEKLARQYRKQVKQNDAEQEQAKDRIGQLKVEINELEQLGLDLRKSLTEKRRELTEAQKQLQDVQKKQLIGLNAVSQAEIEMNELTGQVETLVRQQEVLEEQLNTEVSNCNNLFESKGQLSESCESIRTRIRDTQAEVDRLVGDDHRFELDIQKLESECEADAHAIAELNQRINTAGETIQKLEAVLSSTPEIEKPLQEKLDDLINQREKKDDELQLARESVGDAEIKYKELDQSRLQEQMAVEEIKSSLSEVLAEISGLNAHCESLCQNMKELGAEPAEVAEQLDESFDYETVSAKLQRLARKIENAGAINLTAIEEYEDEKVRKEYMDSQYDDLFAALETLLSTIQKIDRESRKMFLETFEQVNENFQEIFPVLFNGGSAKLELEGEYPDNAGVRIYARPKGKRILHIQALSGGEKALTAVALLLSFFKLNPSPICLLDEIDAPLDDENVIRLCENLRKLSETTQLMMITHNKITMEAVDTLIGITMPEPNVSKLLSVNIEQAREFAA